MPGGGRAPRLCGVYTDLCWRRMGSVRRLQIHLDEPIDEALTREASRRGVSKAAVIRGALARELAVTEAPVVEDPWEALIGWLDSEPVDDIDEVIYEDRA